MKKLIAVVLMLVMCFQLVSCDLLDMFSDGVKEVRETKEEAARTIAKEIIGLLMQEMPAEAEEYLDEIAEIEAELFCPAVREDEDLKAQFTELHALLANCTDPVYAEDITVEQDFQVSADGIDKFVLFVTDYSFTAKVKPDKDAVDVTDEAQTGETNASEEEAITAKFSVSFVMVSNYTADESLVGLHSITIKRLDTGETVTAGVEGLVTPPTNG